MVLQIIKTLMNSVGIIILIAFLLSRTVLFKNLIVKKKVNLKEKILLSLIFGAFGIIGTYTGFPIRGAIANARAVGAIIAGLLGGPFIGMATGFIAGFHRWVIDIGGFTALACGLSTFAEGIIGGLFHQKLKKTNNKWKLAFFVGVISELTQMVIILIVAKPFSEALDLVKIIWFPMTFANSFGVAIFMLIIEEIYLEWERAGAAQAQLALKIANKTLPYLRKGFNEFSAYKTGKIIFDSTDVDGVAITDRDTILTHIGIGQDHHKPGFRVQTEITKRVLETGEYQIALKKEDIECSYSDCPIKSAVIVPLRENNKVIGTLKLYKSKDNGISNIDIQLALGLAQLFSTQLELGKMEYQASMLAKAELKALQAQINPHFLFNAINTIVSVVRTKPALARDLLIHLGEYFRKNLQANKDLVEFEKELEHVKSYMAIEKARFEDRLNIEYRIEENLNLKVPPLILQPIVENAVKHGILPKKGGGKIIIEAKKTGEKVCIRVIDDGVGIENERINEFLENRFRADHVGLCNVNARLRSMYGEENGLKIFSVPGEGTRVTITIPYNLPDERGDELANTGIIG
ncbi:MAG: sensor histidine kinase [Firmicutes bacterium]|nr:sensor histidine kinase [Bacillota bacterium]